jgi:hypothetical protein
MTVAAMGGLGGGGGGGWGLMGSVYDHNYDCAITRQP